MYESEVAIHAVEGQFRVRPPTPPRGGLDVAEHEHAPGASRHPCGDPSKRRGTGVQPLSAEGGVLGLVEAIQADLGLEGSDVLLTNGGIEGEYIATRSLLGPGNEVLSTDPSFLPIHDQVAMSEAKAIEVDIYRKPYVLTPEWANASITPATKMLLLIDPNNPLGSGYTRDQVRGLSDIARDHALWLLNDVPYRDFSKG